MSDLDAIKAMLQRAKIPFEFTDRIERGSKEFPSVQGHIDTEALPDAIFRLSISSNYNGSDKVDGEYVTCPMQPITGGYGSFWSELVFDGEGSLIAVWAWE